MVLGTGMVFGEQGDLVEGGLTEEEGDELARRILLLPLQIML